MKNLQRYFIGLSDGTVCSLTGLRCHKEIENLINRCLTWIENNWAQPSYTFKDVAEILNINL